MITPSTCEKSRALYNFSGKYIYQNAHISPKNYEVCNQMANELITSSMKIIFVLWLSFGIALATPLYILLFTNEREMILPVIYPFIDPDTDSGFYINLASQYVICLFGVFILPGCELILCVLKNGYTAYAAVVENDIMEFGYQLENNKAFSQKYILQFRNIILKIGDAGRFL